MFRKRMLIFAVMLGFIGMEVFAVPAGKIITWGGGGQGAVTFSGSEHAEKGYKCESCHPSLFQMKKGSATMTMKLLNEGRFCGACHDGKVAFSTNNPQKCHECHTTKTKRHDHHNNKKEKHHD